MDAFLISLSPSPPTAHSPNTTTQHQHPTAPTSACDIWSLGATVVELLTGQPPYFDLAPMAALFRIVQVMHVYTYVCVPVCLCVFSHTYLSPHARSQMSPFLR